MKRIAIIGGGLAGLYTGKFLLENGIESFKIFERDSEPRHRCGEVFTTVYNLQPPPTSCTYYTVRRFVFDLHDKIIETYIPFNMFYVTNRVLHEKLLRDELKDYIVIKNVTPRDLHKIADEYDIILDCSGPVSVTSNIFSEAKIKKYAIAISAVIEGILNDVYENYYKSRTLYFLWFTKDIKKYLDGNVGYLWIFPKTSRIANIGYGFFVKNKRCLSLEELFKLIDKYSRIKIDRYNIIGYGGGIIPMQYPRKLRFKLKDSDIYLLGAAASLTNYTLAGGEHLAVLSAKVFTELLCQDREKEYEKMIKKIASRELVTTKIIFEIARRNDFIGRKIIELICTRAYRMLYWF